MLTKFPQVGCLIEVTGGGPAINGRVFEPLKWGGIEKFALGDGPDDLPARVDALKPDFIVWHVREGTTEGDKYRFDQRLRDPPKRSMAEQQAWKSVHRAYRRYPQLVYMGAISGPPPAHTSWYGSSPVDFAVQVMQCINPIDYVSGFIIDEAAAWQSVGNVMARVAELLLPLCTSPFGLGLEAWAVGEDLFNPMRVWHKSKHFSFWCDSNQYAEVVKPSTVLPEDKDIAGPVVILERGAGIVDRDRWGDADGKGDDRAYRRAVFHLNEGRHVTVPPIWNRHHPMFKTAAELKRLAYVPAEKAVA